CMRSSESVILNKPQKKLRSLLLRPEKRRIPPGRSRNSVFTGVVGGYSLGCVYRAAVSCISVKKLQFARIASQDGQAVVSPIVPSFAVARCCFATRFHRRKGAIMFCGNRLRLPSRRNATKRPGRRIENPCPNPILFPNYLPAPCH